MNNPELKFVVPYAVPTLGMERVLLRLVDELAPKIPVSLVLASGKAPDDLGVPVELLTRDGGQIGQLGRMLRLFWWALTSQRSPIVAVGVWAALPCLLASIISPRQVVVWEHSLSREKIATSRNLRVLSVAARLLYKRAASVVAVSAPLASDLTRTAKTTALVIPNLIGPEPAAESRRHVTTGGVRRLITVGSLTDTKRQDVVIEALASLPTDYTLSVVGSGPRLESLQRLTQRLGLQSRVTFHGHVEDPDRLADLLRSADAMVHAAAGETFGLVYFESAQHDVPVLAAENALVSTTIPRYVPGRLFNGNAADLADALRIFRVPSAAEFSRARALREADLATPQIVSRWLGIAEGTRHK